MSVLREPFRVVELRARELERRVELLVPRQRVFELVHERGRTGEDPTPAGGDGLRPRTPRRGCLHLQLSQHGRRVADTVAPPCGVDEVTRPPQNAGLADLSVPHARRNHLKMAERGVVVPEPELEQTQGRLGEDHDCVHTEVGAGAQRAGRTCSARRFEPLPCLYPCQKALGPERARDLLAALDELENRANPERSVLPFAPAPMEVGSYRQRERQQADEPERARVRSHGVDETL